MKKPENAVTVLVATNNKGKISEIIDRLDMKGWSYVTLRERGITVEPEETGATYEENARIKVLSARGFEPQLAVIADDSGLEVDALDGAPGIYSSRYSGEHATDRSNVEKMLEELKAVPADVRTARFVCTIVFVGAGGREYVARGTCEGRIAFAPQGEGGFGYDPIFLPDEIVDGRTMAELSAAEKDSISHRGKALRNLREQLLAAGVEAVGVEAAGASAAEAGSTPRPSRPQSSAKEPVKIAAFDFDDTILEGHSPVHMIRNLVLGGVISPAVAFKSTFWGIRYKLHLPVEQAAVREYVYKGFSHFPADEADRIMAEFYEKNLRTRLRPKAIEAINKHKSEGVKVVIVSASFSPIIKEAAKDLGADHFVSTQMEVEDGYYTGAVFGEPPEGIQKVIQLTDWADKAFADTGWRLVAAYGDHRSDRFLLEAAERAVAVNPDSGLTRAQKKADWEVVDWSFDPK